MHSGKPEKILGKKFVRGKPYYKIKWDGVAKDQATWESPASLRQYKVMINRYEIKNWAAPLDEKFFDPELYLTKGFAPRSKGHDKKKAKVAKREEKRKVQESEPEESESDLSNCEEPGRKNAAENLSLVQPLSGVVENQLQASFISLKGPEQAISIIDIDEKEAEKQGTQNQSEAKKEPEKVPERQNLSANASRLTSELTTQSKKLSNQINLSQIQAPRKPQIAAAVQVNDCEEPAYKNLGLSLVELLEDTSKNPEPKPEPQVQAPRNLSLTNTICLQIEPCKKIKQIAHIYHLQKMQMKNHLYLVEYQNKQMHKLTTSQLLQHHPDQFVSFLQCRLRAKCPV